MSEKSTDGPRKTGDAAAKKAAATDAQIVEAGAEASKKQTPKADSPARKTKAAGATPPSAEAPRAASEAAKAPATPPPAPADPTPSAAAPLGAGESSKTGKPAEAGEASETGKTSGAAESQASGAAAGAAAASRPKDQAEVETDAPAEAQNSAAIAGPLLYGMIGALLGGAIMLLGGRALYGGADAEAVFAPRLAEIEAKIEAAAERADAGQAAALAAAAEAKTAIDGLETATLSREALETRLSALAESADAATAEIARIRSALTSGDPVGGADAAEGAGASAQAAAAAALKVDALAEELATLDAEATALGAELAALSAAGDGRGGRIDALTSRLDSIEAAAKARVSDDAAIGILFAGLSQSVMSGAPYAEALGDLERFAEAEAPEALRGAAERGVATASELAARFDAASAAALGAAVRAAADDGDFLDRLGALVVVRRTTWTEGDDPDAVLSRAAARVAEGDVAGAVAEIEGMAEPALSHAIKAPEMSAWLADARQRLGAEAELARYRAALLGSGAAE